ncbi:S ribonuclease [Pyrus ussuriensis x Pyrus communis]|uniref:S ribonuclease n=1 Tax=Pyrus ussuriensis x Pyrus communis TaxID=2448454 RepID=A0A5N5HY25_9ROSA|nr:S ribonuclease [Pyrus ussuriensis x Pyrus communis]
MFNKKNIGSHLIFNMPNQTQGSQNQVEEAQQGEYWQPYEEFYTTPMQPPQPAQTNSSKSLYNDMVSELLTNLSQGQEDQNKARQNQDKRLDKLEKQIGQIAEFVGQFQDQGKLPSSTIANPKGEFETAKEIMLRSDKEVGTDPQPSKSNYKEDERLQFEEEEHTQPMARVETPLLQAPIAPTPSNSGKVVPKLIISNPVPLDVPISCKIMQSKEEEGEKGIFESFPKNQEQDVTGECLEFIKEDIFETTKPKEVEFDDIGQVITITCNLAKSNIPETFKGVVFVIEFLSEHTGTHSRI